MVTDENKFKQRTKKLALQVIQVVQILPQDRVTNVLGGQLVRSGTSVGANYRAACRAKSPADMIAKLGIVEEEADETGYWLELLVESGIMPKDAATPLLKEADEITAMTVSSIRTLRAKQVNPKSKIQNPK